jgi:heme-degrading monooxygenase HmoA
MTTLVIMRAQGAAEQLREMASRTPNPFEQVRERALASGGILRHRFFHTGNELIVVDEWESQEAFERFMQSPELQKILGEAAEGRPEITFAEQIDVGDNVG